jgi:Dolichyl-phosphate-mannose-protein mannosyltransferase
VRSPALRATRSPDLVRAAAIGVLVFAVYFVSYARTLPPTADELVNFGLAQSLAKWQTPAIDQVSTVGPNSEEFGVGGHRYSKYGPLQAVLAIPLFWLAQRLPIGAVDTVLLLNHLETGLTAALMYLLVRRLGYNPGIALALAALVAFGTPLWVHSKRFFSEPTITLCFVATIYTVYAAATTRRPSWLVLAGLTFGLAVAAKYIDLLLLAPVPVYLALAAGTRPGSERTCTRAAAGLSLWERDPRRVPRVRASSALPAILWFALGFAPIALALLWYDTIRFGNPFLSGYARWETFSTPMYEGLAGFLFSPGKSIFVYTPALLLLPFWAARFVRRFSLFAGLLLAIVVLHLCVYGAWWVWWGAWAWGPRFIVPIFPLLVLFLAEGLATSRRPLTVAVAAVLGLLSVGVQLLGIAVDHTVYLVQLLPQNPKPDTLTLWDIRYQPILHQIPLLTRQWLDFAWIERTGPSAVNVPALLPTLAGATVALVGFVVVWRSANPTRQAIALGLAALVVSGGVFEALRSYDREADPSVRQLATAIGQAPPRTTLVEMIPSVVVAYQNEQKRNLPEIGTIEAPTVTPQLSRQLARIAQQSDYVFALTEGVAKSPSNGVEAQLDRSLIEIGNEPIGPFRLLRYATQPATVHPTGPTWRFADGITLSGYAAPNGPAAAGQPLDLVLRWEASAETVKRPDLTVFVHLIGPDGKLIAQKDDPPETGYAPISQWSPGQVVYDDHTILIPPGVPSGLHLVQVGLYLPTTGERLPLLGPDNRPSGDTATLDLSGAPAGGAG